MSCTEPTALAALALAATDGPRQNYFRAVNWLRSVQCEDGGWPPGANVAQSTWVTSLVVLLPPSHLGEVEHRRGVEWLLSLEGRETSLSNQLVRYLRREPAPPEETHAGWPWFPGAAAWVSPTATGVLALRKLPNLEAARKRVVLGLQFLVARMCADGGWNHGSARALGIEADSYPETTGLALLAMTDLPTRSGRSIETALRHLKNCQSAEGNAWLRLALHAHGIAIPATREVRCHDNRDTALQVLADAATNRGRNIFR